MENYVKRKKINYIIHTAGLSRPMSIHDNRSSSIGRGKHHSRGAHVGLGSRDNGCACAMQHAKQDRGPRKTPTVWVFLLQVCVPVSTLRQAQAVRKDCQGLHCMYGRQGCSHQASHTRVFSRPGGDRAL